MNMQRRGRNLEYLRKSRDTLDRALRDYPAYAPWRRYDPGTKSGIDERYAALPVLTKAKLRACFPHGLIPRGFDLDAALRSGEVEFVTTSGTTAEQVTNVWNQRWWDASERASWQLHPVTKRWVTGSPREAILTSSRNVGRISDETDLAFGDRLEGRLLFLNEKTSPQLWEDTHYQRMIKDLAAYQPEILEANPSYIWRLCRFAAARGIALYQPRAVVFTFERPLAYQLHVIRQVFSCPLISSYGSTELGYVFMQCQYGRLHQNSEFCRVDFQPLAGTPGERRGRILVTTFENPCYQILRFDPGDIVHVWGRPCACGRDEGLVLEDIEGRFSQSTISIDGTMIPLSRLDAVFYGLIGPATYECAQEDRRTYRVRVEEPVDTALVRVRLQRLYGAAARVIIEHVDHISPAPSGKFRHAYTVFPLDMQDFL